MEFTGKEEHTISAEEAHKLVRKHQYQHPNAVKAEFFSRDFIEKLLAQDDCVGMRIYFGLDDKSVQKLVLTGTKANGDDILPGEIGEMGQPCPPLCGEVNLYSL